MRYVTHYEEYPIYEPAEGGYYYAGNQVAEYERLSKRKARAEFERIWAECKADNREMYGEEEPTFTKDEHGNTIYPYFRVNPNKIIRYSKYIGEGESFVIERKLGKDKSGWVPYC